MHYVTSDHIFSYRTIDPTHPLTPLSSSFIKARNNTYGFGNRWSIQWLSRDCKRTSRSPLWNPTWTNYESILLIESMKPSSLPSVSEAKRQPWGGNSVNDVRIRTNHLSRFADVRCWKGCKRNTFPRRSKGRYRPERQCRRAFTETGKSRRRKEHRGQSSVYWGALRLKSGCCVWSGPPLVFTLFFGWKKRLPLSLSSYVSKAKCLWGYLSTLVSTVAALAPAATNLDRSRGHVLLCGHSLSRTWPYDWTT